jgi:predicted nucleic acid-binding protein
MMPSLRTLPSVVAMVEIGVIDASAMVDVLLGGVTAAVLAQRDVWIAPAHFDSEVLSALGRLHRQGVLTDADVVEIIDDLEHVAVARIPTTDQCSRAFELRHNVSLRDGLYVAVAESYRAALLTSDRRLAAACREHSLCDLLAG